MTLTPANSHLLGLPVGLTGATGATRYVGGTASGAPATGTFAVGDFDIDQTGKVWVCTVAGSPGTWVAAGAQTALASGKVSLTGGNITTASTTFVDLTGATVTITTGARRVLLVVTLETILSLALAGIYFDMAVDGTRQGGSNGLQYITQVGTNDEPGSFSYVTDALSAAQHVFKVQWRVSGGTGTVYASATNPVTFAAVELLAA